MARKSIDVLLTTEGTYPTARGGVSTWCDLLVQGMQGVGGINYQIYALLGTPHLPNTFNVPSEVQVLRVPMWGTEEPTEHLDIRFSTVYERQVRTTDEVVQKEFVPLFDQLMAAILGGDGSPRDLGQLFFALHLFFRQYDYKVAFKSRPVWEFYRNGLLTGRWVTLPTVPTLLDALTTIGWIYRFLIVLNTPVPKTDVVHSTAAGFCGLPGVLAKLERNTPYLLTEHGVYLREQYLSLDRSGFSPFAKRFFHGLIRNVVAVNYAYADLIAPVAAFNARWQRRLGVPEERIRVIYNGINPEAFVPQPRPAGAPITVAAVSRIDPTKDILTLIEAAAIVRQTQPDVRFVVYGGVSVKGYYEDCLALRDSLGLADSFTFAGHVTDVAGAYASTDIVVLSSITEGFPFAVIEAMMAGRPVIATDVGGVREACEGTAVLVPPRNPEEMAAQICRLLNEPDLRLSLAEEGRDRALERFTTQRVFDLYRQTYEDLAGNRSAIVAAAGAESTTRLRHLSIDRARALVAIGQLPKAIAAYQEAVALDPTGPSTPALLLMIADLYLRLGDEARARYEMERAEALAAAIHHLRVA